LLQSLFTIHTPIIRVVSLLHLYFLSFLIQLIFVLGVGFILLDCFIRPECSFLLFVAKE
jgi:hypothetical protein